MILFLYLAAQTSFGWIVQNIILEGQKQLQSPEMQQCIKIQKGQPFEQKRLDQSVQECLNFYHNKGYQQATITVRKDNRNIYLKVAEGIPTRIKRFDCQSNSHLDFSFLDYLNHKDILDQEKIDQVKNLIIEKFITEDYLDAEIKKVNIIPVDDFNLKEKFVTVQFEIDAGKQFKFFTQGNQFFTYGYLINLIKKQKMLHLGAEYISNIQSILVQEYQSQGFMQVEVEPFIEEGITSTEKKGVAKENNYKKITYIIHEGPRYTLEKVDFQGSISFSQEELNNIFFENASYLTKNKFYSQKDVVKSLDFFLQSFKERGYLSCELISFFTNFDHKKNTVNIFVRLQEGIQTQVRAFHISGNSIISTEEIKEQLCIRENTPLNLFLFTEKLNTIKEYYYNHGYLEFYIKNEGTSNVINYEKNNALANIYLDFFEGEKSVLTSIQIIGIKKTKMFIVQNALTFRIGETLTKTDILQSEENIRKLGIFSYVQLQTIPDEKQPHKKTIKIILEENDLGALVYGPGFRSDLGIRGFAQVSFNNLFGLSQTAQVSANLNRRIDTSMVIDQDNYLEGQAQVAYIWPYFLEPTLTFRPVVSIGRTKYVNFSTTNITLLSSWDKILLEKPSLMATFTYSFEKIKQFHASSVGDNGLFDFSIFGLKISLDLRDNPLAPNKGFFMTTWADIAPPFFGSYKEEQPLGFYKVRLRADQHIPLWGGIGLFASFRTGYEKAFLNAIPFYQAFALGGIASVRGFAEQSIYHPYEILTSLSYINYRFQIDIPIANAIKIGFFYDAANLMVDSYSFIKNLYSSVGAGIRYITPIGPLSIDFGFPVAYPTDDVNINIVSLSVGVI